MSVFVIGLNHCSAPLALLERTTISDSHLPKALSGALQCENVTGTVILSTCHRTEIYVSASAFHGAHKTLKTFLSDLTFVSEQELNSHLYSFSDTDAAAHLFCVASGMDSAILGEYEIQGQVKRAWAVAKEETATDSVIDNLFRRALETGKRVRRQTHLSRGTVSVSDAAVELATECLGTINNMKAVVLGSGEMGKRICTLLVREAAGDIAIASRTFQNADRLAKSHSCRAVHLDEISREIVNADVLFSSTGASTLLLERDEMERFMKARLGRPLLVVDIAVPRDIDPLSEDIEGLTLKDIDDVRVFVSSVKEEYEEGLHCAQEILTKEVTRYESQIQTTKLAPLIVEFRRHICEISQDEFDRYNGKLSGLESTERETVEELVHSIINKVLHSPTVSLQNVSEETAERLAASLKELFDL